jgi:glycosyltransferase involved in cell wall biosynthesis
VPTIEAALEQTFTDFELLVIGDGVTDDTLDQVPRSDRRVSVVALPPPNSGQARPNNAGIAAARGSYVAYLGHDDIWMPDHLAALAQVFEETGCDVAVSGCAFHGPPGTDSIDITGLFENSEDARRHFFPPTSFAHRLSLAPQIGGWRAPHTIHAPVDSDFLLRSVGAGARFVSTGRVTAHKFTAGHRYLSYLDQSSAEQREVLAAIRCGAIDRRICADYVKRAKAAGTFMQMMYPNFDAFAPGDLYRASRSSRGLERVASVPLTGEVHVLPSNESRGWDWYGVEQPAGSPPFRFSGPSLRPKLLIPFTGDIPARITLHLLARITFPLADYDPEGMIDGIRLTLNGSAIEHQIRRDDPNRIDIDIIGRLRPEQPSVLEVLLPRAFCPADARWRRIWSLVSGRTLDRRRLGVALTGFTLAPVAPRDMGNGLTNEISPPVGIVPAAGPVAGARLPALAVAWGAALWIVRKLLSRLSRGSGATPRSR